MSEINFNGSTSVKGGYSQRLGQRVVRVKHKSGLEIIVYPMDNCSSAYAIFGTRFGSVNNCFKLKGENEPITVPDGIAHFLEHKLFENEDCDAFERYAKTGADANAYTSFDKTCYLFSCTENFNESLEILLDFVTAPYFTQQTVDKEQGIIGQEIKMYDDNPQWQVYFGAIRNLYHNHSVNVDIAGTVESIAKITPEYLYRCYNTFYSLNNMVLCVCGNISANQVIEVADKVLKDCTPVEYENYFKDEPIGVKEKITVKNFPVAIPIFTIGYKQKWTGEPTDKDVICTEILMQIILGKASPLFRKLLDSSLINERIGTEYLTGPGYCSILIDGESNNPEKVKEELDLAIEDIRLNGIDPEEFEIARRTIYGRYINTLETAEDMANLAVDCYFGGRDIFAMAEAVASVTVKDIENSLNYQLLSENSTISIVRQEEE